MLGSLSISADSSHGVTRSPSIAPWLLLLLLSILPDLIRAAAVPRSEDESYWKALLHVRSPFWSGRQASQADDPRFFFASPDDDWTPERERSAFIQALEQTPFTAGDRHPACRFPLRAAWIREQFRPDLSFPSPAECPALSQWLETVPGSRLTLIFAASYLNNPSSMFGHTLLRIDAEAERPTLLSPTISYAADAAAHEGELSFAYKGIFGGFPGITTIEPYYRKIRMYSAMEHRDIWEYELNLTPQEVERLRLHTWEVKDTRFDYYFFDENCAWRLLALIEVARPGVHLIDTLPFQRVIPAETVKVVRRAGLIDTIHYRPSLAETAAWKLGQLSADESDSVALFLQNPEASRVAVLDQGSVSSRARKLEAAYEKLRYESESPSEDIRRIERAAAVELLQARGQLGQIDSPPVPVPGIRDDEGHSALRIGVQGGLSEDQGLVALQWRPAYHDFLDPPGGYRQGAHLQFLNTEFRLEPERSRLRLHELELVEILSLTPRDQWFKPLSWQAAGGLKRFPGEGQDWVLSPYVEGFAGYTMAAGPLLGSLGLQARFAAHSHLPKGLRADIGPRLLAAFAATRWRVAAEAGFYPDWLSGERSVLSGGLQASFSIDRSQALVLRIESEDWQRGSSRTLLAGWHGWF